MKSGLLFGFVVACLGTAAHAQAGAADAALAERIQPFAEAAAQRASASGLRVAVRVGTLDPRLRLAPCHAVTPYLPANTRLWGAARIGLRCADPGVRWHVFLPIQVDVFGPGWVAVAPLAAGTVLAAEHLRRDEVNLSASPQAAVDRLDAALGRALARPLAAGDTLRGSDLRARQWFAAGDTVRLIAAGSGWRIDGQGQAMAPGLEGGPVRVRTESGRVVSGTAVGERLVEIAL